MPDAFRRVEAMHMTVGNRFILVTIALLNASFVSDQSFYPVSNLTIPIPTYFFGMHIFDRNNWPPVPVGALGKGMLTGWHYIERIRGIYDWSNLDAWVSTAQSHNVDFFYSFYGVPEWAASDLSSCEPAFMKDVKNCSSMPKNIQDFDAFVSALVTRYKGKIKYYELWNEPHYVLAITIPDMVTLTSHIHNIIRSIDPNAKIIAPSLDGRAPAYADSYYAAGGVKDVDIISLHSYPRVNNNVPEMMMPDQLLLGPLRHVISKYGLQHKPLWSTEGSWGDESKGAITDPEQQVAFLARFFLLHWSSGLTRFYWYAWDDDSWGTLKDRRAATAFTQIQRWMIGATMTNPCSNEPPHRMIWTCGFSRHNGYRAIAMWTSKGSISVPVPSEYKQYRDLYGNLANITDHTVSIGSKPILLETESAF